MQLRGGEPAQACVEREVLETLEVVVEAVLALMVDRQLGGVDFGGLGVCLRAREHQVAESGGRALRLSLIHISEPTRPY